MHPAMRAIDWSLRAREPAKGSPDCRGCIISGITNLLFVLALAVIGTYTPTESRAQEAADHHAYDTAEIEEIIVTGTRIKRRDFDTPSPLTTLDAADLAFSGQVTVEETLNQMPQVFPQMGRTSNNPSLGNNPGLGSAEVDLRGFGPGRTLVLLNGRRVAPSGTGSGVDLNNIPQFLIDRVEIITGGTSAVYGSDAIAGVVNFITKQDYSGFGVETGISISEPGDAEVCDLNLIYGHNFANGRGNLSLSANMHERKPVFAGDREFTRVYWIDDWQGSLVAGGSSATPEGHIFSLADLGDGPVEITFDTDGEPREYVFPDDTYNFQPVNYLQIPLTRYAVTALGSYDLTRGIEAYVEASFIRNEPSIQLAPVPAFLPVQINLDNPLLTPEAAQLFADNYTCDTNLACVFLGKRLLELGPRRNDYERDYLRMLTGLKVDLGQGWVIDGWITYTSVSSSVFFKNDASEARLRQGLLVEPVTNECFDRSGGCVPLNIFGANNISAAGVDFIRYDDFVNVTERTHKLASLFVTGSPFNTWAGPAETAIGAEWRSDETSFKADDALFTGDTLGFNGQSAIQGTEEVFEIYAEAVVPLASDSAWAEYLGLDFGARYSDYKNAGSMWTYKAGGEWQPVEGLRIRAMHERSARAPNTGELFEEQRTVTVSNLLNDTSNDPCSASADPVGNGNVDKCIAQGLPPEQIGDFEATLAYPVERTTGGNPELRPEVGKTWTLGAVIAQEWMNEWVLSIDYFAIEVTDTIGPISAFAICFDSANNAGLFCDNIQRDASGNIAEVTQLTSNRGRFETTGIDTQVRYAANLPDILAFRDHDAGINIDIYWTHMLSNKSQENPVTQVLDCAGYFGWPCDTDLRASTFSEDRVTSNLHYSSGPLELHATWRWIKGTENAAPLGTALQGLPDPDLAVAAVDDEHYLDIGLGYSFSDDLTARFGITNLLNNSPPMMASAVFDNNTDTGLYDIFGRSYYLKLLAEF